MKNIKIHKGLLSFLSGLGWMGLAFYVWFFTMKTSITNFNLLFAYSIATAALGAIVVLFVLIAFSVIPPLPRINSTAAGFLAGILSMAAIIFMLLAINHEDGLDKIHPITTFFLAAASTYLLLHPEEEKEEWKL